MQIINIEKDVFDEIKKKFEDFSNRIIDICRKHQIKKENDWLDNQDVCLLLNISPRTLQTYRDTGKISFSQINHKMYYRSSDIEKLLQSNKIQ